MHTQCYLILSYNRVFLPIFAPKMGSQLSYNREPPVYGFDLEVMTPVVSGVMFPTSHHGLDLVVCQCVWDMVCVCSSAPMHGASVTATAGVIE